MRWAAASVNVLRPWESSTSSSRLKTELIADRVWRTRGQLELAIVEWVGWFNNDRLHESLGDRPPAEVETLYQSQDVLTPSPNQ